MRRVLKIGDAESLEAIPTVILENATALGERTRVLHRQFYIRHFCFIQYVIGADGALSGSKNAKA